MNRTDLECFRGDTAAWTIAATLDGLVLPLTDCVVYMTARRNEASPVIFELTSLPSGGIVIAEDPETGVCTAKLREADTLVLSSQTTYLVYSIRVVNTVTGDANVTAFGTLTVKAAAGPA